MADLENAVVVQSSRPLAKYRAAPWFVVLTVSVAVFDDIYMNTFIIPILPFDLASRVHIDSIDVIRWDAILLSLSGASAFVASSIYGWASNKYLSHKAALLVGLLLQASATSMLCGGVGLPVLCISRILQGFSTAATWTAGLPLLVDTFGETNIGYAMGYVCLSMNAASLSGTILGGLTYQRAGWYASFAIPFGLLAIDGFFRLLFIQAFRVSDHNSATGSAGSVDTANLVRNPALADLNENGATTQSAPPCPLPVPPPKSSRLWMPLRLLFNGRMLATLWILLVQGICISSFDVALPIRVHTLFGWESLGAGLIFLPIALPALAAPLCGSLCDRYGPRWIVTISLLAAGPCYVCLRFVVTVPSSIPAAIVLLSSLLGLVGLCMTAVITPLLAEISHAYDAIARQHTEISGPGGAYGQAYSLFSMTLSVSFLIGPLWAGLILDSTGWNTLGWSLGVLCFASAFPAAAAIHGRERTS